MPVSLVRTTWNLVREKSVKSQGILLCLICGNAAVGVFFIIKLGSIYTGIGDRPALLFIWALWPFKIWNRGPPSRSRPR